MMTLDFLREQTIGTDAPIETPFGTRPLVYADYTASGRCLAFVEDYCRSLATLYANSHTEDSLTGHASTKLLHEAETSIKRALNAGPGGKVIACGNGSTGAIHKLQQILGIAIPPATRERLAQFYTGALGAESLDRLERHVAQNRPVVFVGPYEHHSNEVSWREGVCEVVEVELDAEGALDLGDLERLLKDARWQGRQRIGSFSAASNVTGVTSPVHEIARLLHRHDALALFDFAASAPYVPIDMCPGGDPEAALDAVFLSPHKFLGGPGSAGILVFNEKLYPRGLPPTVGAGGTVTYVTANLHDFTDDVEEREKPGTPGVFQTLRAALALDIKRALGVETIQAREHDLLARAFEAWGADERIEILGPQDPEKRIGIVSFNLADGRGSRLHPKLVTCLLNDLFGIQSRAGCSCAGPYGHRLMGVDDATSFKMRGHIERGIHGIKPGWCRIGFHYTMDDAEADYVIEAVRFIAEHGRRFLPLYHFDVASGAWTHRAGQAPMPTYSLNAALSATFDESGPCSETERRALYEHALQEAQRHAERLPECESEARLDGELGELQTFALAE